MTTVRSLLFVVWLYLSMAVFAVGLSPTLLLPYRVAMTVIRVWAKFILQGHQEVQVVANCQIDLAQIARGALAQPAEPARCDPQGRSPVGG